MAEELLLMEGSQPGFTNEGSTTSQANNTADSGLTVLGEKYSDTLLVYGDCNGQARFPPLGSSPWNFVWFLRIPL